MLQTFQVFSPKAFSFLKHKCLKGRRFKRHGVIVKIDLLIWTSMNIKCSKEKFRKGRGKIFRIDKSGGAFIEEIILQTYSSIKQLKFRKCHNTFDK